MALVVLPLFPGKGSTDPWSPVEEFGAHVALARHGGLGGGGKGGRGAAAAAAAEEALAIVDGVVDRDVTPRSKALEDTQVLWSGRTGKRPLSSAVEAVLVEMARQRHRGKVTGDLDPSVLVIVPVLVLSDDSPDLSLLTKTVADLDAVAARLAARALAGSPALAAGGTRIVPWAFVEGAVRVPEELFEGPQRFGNGCMTPLIYGGLSVDQSPRTWDGYGSTRLLTDLLALYALSASRARFDQVFPPRTAGERKVLYLAHSALFEDPFDAAIRHELLRRMVGDSRVLPDPSGLDRLAENCAEAVETETAGHVAALGEVLGRDELGAGAFALGGKPGDGQAAEPIRPPGAPRPDLHLGPDDRHWLRWASSNWSVVAPPRRAPAAHARFQAYVEAVAKEDFLAPYLVTALGSAHQCLETERGAIEVSLRVALGQTGEEVENEWADLFAEEESQDAVGQSKLMETTLPAATGRVLALLQGVARGLESAEQQARAQETSTEPVVERCAGLRGSWIAREEELLRAGTKVPSLGAALLEAVALILAILVGVPALFDLFGDLRDVGWAARFGIGGGAGLLVAGLVFRQRMEQIKQYLALWSELRSSLRSQVDGELESLRKRLDARLRYAKLLAAGELRRALNLAESRFSTEVVGFVSLVQDELALLTAARRDESGRSEGLVAAGRYRHASPSMATLTFDAKELHKDIKTRLKRSLTVVSVPRAIPLERHREILGDQVTRAVQQLAYDGDGDSAAVKLLETGLRDAFDPNASTRFGHGRSVGVPVHCVLVGRAVRARLDVDAILSGVNQGLQGRPLIRCDPTSRSTIALPDEIAVGLSVRRTCLDGGTP